MRHRGFGTPAAFLVSDGALDIANPLSHGLTYAFAPGGGGSEAQGNRADPHGTRIGYNPSVASDPAIQAGQMGMEYRRSSLSTTYFEEALPNPLSSTQGSRAPILTPRTRRDMTYSAMFRFDTVAFGFIFEMRETAGNPFAWMFWHTSNVYYVGFYNSAGGSTDITVPHVPVANTWYRLTVVWQESSVRCFLNGSLVQVSSDTTTLRSASLPNLIRIGNRTGGSPDATGIRGSVRDVFLWDRALTDSEVLSHYIHPYQFLTAPESFAAATVSTAAGGPLVCSPRLLERLTINRLAGF